MRALKDIVGGAVVVFVGVVLFGIFIGISVFFELQDESFVGLGMTEFGICG